MLQMLCQASRSVDSLAAFVTTSNRVEKQASRFDPAPRRFRLSNPYTLQNFVVQAIYTQNSSLKLNASMRQRRRLKRPRIARHVDRKGRAALLAAVDADAAAVALDHPAH
jgi:hypothetical protein